MLINKSSLFERSINITIKKPPKKYRGKHIPLLLKWSIEWNARTWGIWTKRKCLYLLQEVRGGRTSEEMFFKCFYIEKRVEVYNLIYHGIFRLWCVASLKIFFIRIKSSKNFKKKQTSKALVRNNFCLRQQGTWHFIKHFWSWSKYMYVGKVLFLLQTNISQPRL